LIGFPDALAGLGYFGAEFGWFEDFDPTGFAENPADHFVFDGRAEGDGRTWKFIDAAKMPGASYTNYLAFAGNRIVVGTKNAGVFYCDLEEASPPEDMVSFLGKALNDSAGKFCPSLSPKAPQ